MQPGIIENDWVLICETNERGQVISVFDEGERFMVQIGATEKWPFPKTVHVMVEKVRKIRPPKKDDSPKWYQVNLFGDQSDAHNN